MTDILFSPIKLNELEILIENSVSRVFKNYDLAQKFNEQPDRLISCKEAAEYLGLSLQELAVLSTSNELLPVTTGRKAKYSTKQLADWKNKKGVHHA